MLSIRIEYPYLSLFLSIDRWSRPPRIPESRSTSALKHQSVHLPIPAKSYDFLSIIATLDINNFIPTYHGSLRPFPPSSRVSLSTSIPINHRPPFNQLTTKFQQRRPQLPPNIPPPLLLLPPYPLTRKISPKPRTPTSALRTRNHPLRTQRRPRRPRRKRPRRRTRPLPLWPGT